MCDTGLATFCFDISVLELFLPLCYGARLVLASSGIQKDPRAILNLIAQQRVNVMQVHSYEKDREICYIEIGGGGEERGRGIETMKS
jgi:non-ribosomal peptide synthetase component F